MSNKPERRRRALPQSRSDRVFTVNGALNGRIRVTDVDRIDLSKDTSARLTSPGISMFSLSWLGLVAPTMVLAAGPAAVDEGDRLRCRRQAGPPGQFGVGVAGGGNVRLVVTLANRGNSSSPTSGRWVGQSPPCADHAAQRTAAVTISAPRSFRSRRWHCAAVRRRRPRSWRDGRFRRKPCPAILRRRRSPWAAG